MPASDEQPAGGPAMPKPSQDAVERFRGAVGDDPRVSLRPMFGNLAAFANGYLFAGLFGDDIFVRGDGATQAAILAQGGHPFAPMPGRPMRDYAVLPAAVAVDATELRSRIGSSLAFTMTLPPKPPKPLKPPKVPKTPKPAGSGKA